MSNHDMMELWVGMRRGPAVGREILLATRELLGEGGYAALTIEGVAARAGVARTTVYRRWATKQALVLEALIESVDLASAVRPSQGEGASSDWGAELRELAQALAAALRESDAGHTIPALAADLAHEPELATRFRGAFAAPLTRPLIVALQRGIAAGQVRPGLNLDTLASLIVAPIIHRLILGAEPATPSFVDELVELAVAAAADVGPHRGWPRPG